MSCILTPIDDDVVAVMLERLANGESLKAMCLEKGMPRVKLFYHWLRKYPEFAKAYELAKEECADNFAEEMITIADDKSEDWITVIDENGNEKMVFNKEHVHRSRLRIDTRKFLAMKLKPKRYGDKIIHSGDNDAPIKHSIKVEFVNSNTGSI